MDAFFALIGFSGFFVCYAWGWMRISRSLETRGFRFVLRHVIACVVAFFPAFFYMLPLMLISAKERSIGGAIFCTVLFLVSVLSLFYTTKIVKPVESQVPLEDSPPLETSVIEPAPVSAQEAVQPSIQTDIKDSAEAPVDASKEKKLNRKECTCRLCERRVSYFTQTCPRCSAWQPAYSLRTLALCTISAVIFGRVFLSLAFDFSFLSWIDWLYIPAVLVWVLPSLVQLQRDDESILEKRRYDPNRVYPTAAQVALEHRMKKSEFAQNVLKFEYEDADGRTSTRTIKNWVEDPVYIEGFCLDKNAVRTFRKDRIIVYLDGTQYLLENPLPISEESEEKEAFIVVKRQILFTGFSKSERAFLEQKARDHGFIVCQSVTVSLDYICTGKNAGYAKIEDARSRGATELDVTEFEQLIETGEVPIHHS